MHSNTKWHAWLFSWNKSFLVITVICSCRPCPNPLPQPLCAPITAVWGISSECEHARETGAKTARGWKKKQPRPIVTRILKNKKNWKRQSCLFFFVFRNHKPPQTASHSICWPLNWRGFVPLHSLPPHLPQPSNPYSLCPDKLLQGLRLIVRKKKTKLRWNLLR